jgi:hypothetical protein
MSEYEPYLTTTWISLIVSSAVVLLNDYILYRYRNRCTKYDPQTANENVNIATSELDIQRKIPSDNQSNESATDPVQLTQMGIGLQGIKVPPPVPVQLTQMAFGLQGRKVPPAPVQFGPQNQSGSQNQFGSLEELVNRSKNPVQIFNI